MNQMININSEYSTNYDEPMEKKVFSLSSSPKHKYDISLMD